MVKEKGLKWTLQVTYEKWRYKSNPKYPSAHKVIKKFGGFLYAEIASCTNQILKNYKWNSCFKSLAASNYLGTFPIINMFHNFLHIGNSISQNTNKK